MNIIVTSIGNVTAAYAASLAVLPITPNTFYILAIALLVAVFLLGLILGLFISQRSKSAKAAKELPPPEAPPQSKAEDEDYQINNEPMQQPYGDQRRYDNRDRSRYYY